MNSYLPFISLKINLKGKIFEAMREADISDLWKLNEKRYSDLIDYGTDEFIKTYWSIFL